MRQAPHWDRRHKLRSCSASAEDFDLIRAANRDVSELPIPIIGEVHVIGDWASLEQRFLIERRFRAKHFDLAGVLQRDPNFIVFRTNGDVGAKWARMR